MISISLGKKWKKGITGSQCMNILYFNRFCQITKWSYQLTVLSILYWNIFSPIPLFFPQFNRWSNKNETIVFEFPFFWLLVKLSIFVMRFQAKFMFIFPFYLYFTIHFIKFLHLHFTFIFLWISILYLYNIFLCDCFAFSFWSVKVLYIF